MKTMIGRRMVAAVSVTALVFGLLPGTAVETLAKKKAVLATKKLSLNVGGQKKIRIKNKKKNCRYRFTSSKKAVASVTKAGKVIGKKVGKAVITVKESGKNGTNRVVGKAKVTVKAKNNADKNQNPAPTEAVQVTPQPTVTPTLPPAGTQTEQPAVSQTPAVTETPAPTPTPVPTRKPVDRVNFEMPVHYDWERDEQEYGVQETISYYSTTTETTRKANVILPLNYSEEKQYPVLYLLHGIGGDHNEWNGANPRYMIGNLVADGDAREMIIVMPNVRARANDAANSSLTLEHFQAFDNFINDLRDNLMPYIAENYSIKTGRENTAIAGLSMGGRTSLYIGITMADTFGYIGAFSPAVGVLGYSGNVTEEGLFKEEELKLPDEYNNGNTLLLICNGDSDTIVYDTPAKYHRVLEENGTDHIYYEIEGGGHDFNVWKNGLYNFAKRIFQ